VASCAVKTAYMPRRPRISRPYRGTRRGLPFSRLFTLALGAAWLPRSEARSFGTVRCGIFSRGFRYPILRKTNSRPLKVLFNTRAIDKTDQREVNLGTQDSRFGGTQDPTVGGKQHFRSPGKKRRKSGSLASTLILIRHGESTWNRVEDERFTGWYDAPLSLKGKREAREAGNLLREKGILEKVSVAFTSKLQRSYDTLDLILGDMIPSFPIHRSWRLNERHYGALQGYNKDAVINTLYDPDDVRNWRRSWDIAPPLMTDDHPHYNIVKKQYSEEEIKEMGGDIPRGESLVQTAARLVPLWHSQIHPNILNGSVILVVAHANSLRSLIASVFDVEKEEIEKLRIPTGTPLIYNLDGEGKPLPVPDQCGILDGEFLWPLDECPVLFDDFELVASLQRVPSDDTTPKF